MRLQSIKPAYLWALGVTTLLTIWALFASDSASTTPVAEFQLRRSHAAQDEAGSVISPVVAGSQSSAMMSVEQGAEITAAQVDIFATRRSPAVEPAAATAPASAAMDLAGPPLPPPPPLLNIQFAGRFRTPDGHALVYLRDGEKFVVAKVGDTTSSGYQVVAFVGDGERVLRPEERAGRISAVRFLYAPLRHTEVLTLPLEAAAL